MLVKVVELGRSVSESQSFYKKLLASDRFFHVSDIPSEEFLRPVLESQTLSARNCWFQTGSYLLQLKRI